MPLPSDGKTGTGRWASWAAGGLTRCGRGGRGSRLRGGLRGDGGTARRRKKRRLGSWVAAVWSRGPAPAATLVPAFLLKGEGVRGRLRVDGAGRGGGWGTLVARKTLTLAPLPLSRLDTWFTGVRGHGLHVWAGFQRLTVASRSVMTWTVQQAAVAVGRTAARGGWVAPSSPGPG